MGDFLDSISVQKFLYHCTAASNTRCCSFGGAASNIKKFFFKFGNVPENNGDRHNVGRGDKRLNLFGVKASRLRCNFRLSYDGVTVTSQILEC